MKAAMVGILALAGASAASAQGVVPPRFNPRAPENSQILASFSYASVESVLSGIGARSQRAGQPGQPALLVSFPNNRKAVLMFGSCNADGSACKALSIQSYWTRIAHAPPQQTQAAIADFNRRYSFAKAFIAEDGRPALQRYLTADYGFVRGNLAVNLLVFANQAERFARDVLGPLEASGK
ncbi:YbjN domain-containing protein [Sphingosinicella humi]|uniref:YbjN domain-containing protein n=1 Tax=Allosphingosinicella humi TaxID=2068657 RepID=A0A2U2J5Q2_9SPHN|nr:YbjN domain-containing protein [Sphingosinicella humi]PWG03632.1 hypothetical protein DF286_12660 [Sphingosinicella humi]